MAWLVISWGTSAAGLAYMMSRIATFADAPRMRPVRAPQLQRVGHFFIALSVIPNGMALKGIVDASGFFVGGISSAIGLTCVVLSLALQRRRQVGVR